MTKGRISWIWVRQTLFRQIQSYPCFPPHAANCVSSINNLLGYKIVGSASNPNLRNKIDETNVRFLRLEVSKFGGCKMITQ
jgi:hypothetical protein